MLYREGPTAGSELPSSVVPPEQRRGGGGDALGVVGDNQRRRSPSSVVAIGPERGGDHGLTARESLEHFHPHPTAHTHRGQHDACGIEMRLDVGSIGNDIDVRTGQGTYLLGWSAAYQTQSCAGMPDADG